MKNVILEIVTYVGALAVVMGAACLLGRCT